MNSLVDCWGLGCILHFLCTKELAFNAATDQKYRDLIREGYKGIIPKIYGQNLQ